MPLLFWLWTPSRSLLQRRSYLRGSRTHRPPPVHFLRPRYWWLVYHLSVLQFFCISCTGSLPCLLRCPLCQSPFCVPNVHIRYSKWHYCQLLCGRRCKGICLSPVVGWVPVHFYLFFVMFAFSPLASMPFFHVFNFSRSSLRVLDMMTRSSA